MLKNASLAFVVFLALGTWLLLESQSARDVFTTGPSNFEWSADGISEREIASAAESESLQIPRKKMGQLGSQTAVNENGSK